MALLKVSCSNTQLEIVENGQSTLLDKADLDLSHTDAILRQRLATKRGRPVSAPVFVHRDPDGGLVVQVNGVPDWELFDREYLSRKGR